MNLEEKDLILNFIKGHKIAILSTNSESGWPESAAIEFGETDNLEIIFDTVTSYRKYKNLQNNHKVSFVIGWDKSITVQYEGLASELSRESAEVYKEIFFKKNPEARKWEKNPEISYFVVKPQWIRYSDLNVKPWKIIELKF